MTQPSLDRTDLRILELMQEHGDLSAGQIAERLDLTSSTAWRRITRLQELGVIRRRVALLDREKLGLSVLVFSHVKVAGHGRDALLRFEQAVRAHPEILECYTLMGETDFLLRIVCRDIKAYEAFFLDHLSRFPGVQSVNSSIALAMIKETTALPLRLPAP
ncbi:MAG: Lrp/AsnC family transcriptional regulator [Proteobacteria bacterium]|nr:Lrp/AsnC family transcriptional regulator [Pseudomonadota bacterium]